jgi:hypothetical protein
MPLTKDDERDAMIAALDYRVKQLEEMEKQEDAFSMEALDVFCRRLLEVEKRLGISDSPIPDPLEDKPTPPAQCPVCNYPYGKPATAHLTEQEIAHIKDGDLCKTCSYHIDKKCRWLCVRRVEMMMAERKVDNPAPTPPALDVEGVVRAFMVWHFDCDNEQEHDEIVAVYVAARKETK